MEKATSIEAFILQYPAAVQMELQQLRKAILQAAPQAEECISYGIPTFKLYGNLVHFSAYEKHIGFYPGTSGIEAFKNELSMYKSAKGSVQFPIGTALPLALIKKITRFRVQQNKEAALTKKSAAKK